MLKLTVGGGDSGSAQGGGAGDYSDIVTYKFSIDVFLKGVRYTLPQTAKQLC